MENKIWPRNLKAEEIRKEMNRIVAIIDEEQNRYEILEEELKRRGLKL